MATTSSYPGFLTPSGVIPVPIFIRPRGFYSRNPYIVQVENLRLYENCRLCPRLCRVKRLGEGPGSRRGFCRETHDLRVAHVGPHFGEEPPLTGERGSGAIFFAGCTLRCTFCQNHQISHGGVGTPLSLEQLLERVSRMILGDGVHNVNFVTPDHFFPHVFSLVGLLRSRDFGLPVLYNLSGYQSLDMLKEAEGYVDIYLPDFKYADSSLAGRLSKCGDYPETALEAIVEMVRQKGFLDACTNGSELAKKGVLVRHLILPGYVENSLGALTCLFVEFGRGLPLSLMSQYHPVVPQQDGSLNRFLYKEEFDRVYHHALDLGFENLFVQFPEEHPEEGSTFLPDFLKRDPFG
jgi:putative pyruvate formate lyase activating enzyme